MQHLVGIPLKHHALADPLEAGMCKALINGHWPHLAVLMYMVIHGGLLMCKLLARDTCHV